MSPNPPKKEDDSAEKAKVANKLKAPWFANVEMPQVEPPKGDPIEDRIISTISVIVCYEDPGFPMALKSLLSKPEHKPMLLMYEA